MKRLSLFILLCAGALSADDMELLLEDSMESEDRTQLMELADLKEAKPRDPFLPPPADAVFFEGEDMECDGKPNIRTLIYSDWHDGLTSGNRGLGGPFHAKKRVTLKKSGWHKIWFRFLDSRREEGKEFDVSGHLKISFLQNGKKLPSAELTKAFSPLSNEAGLRKYHARNTPRSIYVWQAADFKAKKGELDIELEGNGYFIDCAVVTSDRGYEPNHMDFTPLWVKIRVPADQTKPIAVRTPDSQWLITKDGMKEVRPLVASKKGTGVLIPPGGESPWCYLPRFFGYHSHPTVRFTATDDVLKKWDSVFHPKNEEHAKFEILFSTTNSDKGVYYRADADGSTGGIGFVVGRLANTKDGRPDRLASHTDLSKVSLARANAAGEVGGRYPEKFPFAASFAFRDLSPVGRNELAALAGIGINKGWNEAFRGDPNAEKFIQKDVINKSFSFIKYYDKCPCSPLPGADRRAREIFGPTIGHAAVTGFDDEPSGAGTNCPKCTEHFREFLKERGLPPEELGFRRYGDAYPMYAMSAKEQRAAALERENLAEGASLEKASRGPASEDASIAAARMDEQMKPEKWAARYYWSQRYRMTLLAKYFKYLTDAIRTVNPQTRTACNMSTEIVFEGNLLKRAADWFEIYESGALTDGLTEDWANLSGNYRIAGYQADVMRAACRKTNSPFGFLNILCSGRTGWEIAAKGFVEIGHGARSLLFFNYGPWYLHGQDSPGDRADIYEGIKRVTYPTGAAEDILLSGRVSKGDAASLLSRTADIWNLPKWIGSGREREWCSFLFNHCSVRTDVLDETHLADRLNEYPLLLVNDVYLKREYLPVILDWVKNGGALFLTAGALQFDEYRRNLGFDAATGISRELFDYFHEENGGWDALDAMRGRAPLPEKERKKRIDADAKANVVTKSGTLRVTAQGFQRVAAPAPSSGARVLYSFDNGNPAVVEYPFGKGKIFLAAFAPGMAYQGSSVHKDGDPESRREYFEPAREIVRTVLTESHLSPALDSGNPQVEVMRIESDKADALVLSNWTFADAETLVTIRNAPEYRSVKSVSGKILKQERKGSDLYLTVRLNAGDYIVCEK